MYVGIYNKAGLFLHEAITRPITYGPWNFESISLKITCGLDLKPSWAGRVGPGLGKPKLFSKPNFVAQTDSNRVSSIQFEKNRTKCLGLTFQFSLVLTRLYSFRNLLFSTIVTTRIVYIYIYLYMWVQGRGGKNHSGSSPSGQGYCPPTWRAAVRTPTKALWGYFLPQLIWVKIVFSLTHEWGVDIPRIFVRVKI